MKQLSTLFTLFKIAKLSDDIFSHLFLHSSLQLYEIGHLCPTPL